MGDTIRLHSDFYLRDAIGLAAARFSGKARFEIEDAGSEVVVTAAPIGAVDDAFAEAWGEFRNQALSTTVRERRAPGHVAPPRAPESTPAPEPPWALLSPFTEGVSLALGWTLGSLGPIRSGAATLELRHREHGVARILIRRKDGVARGVAHTEHLDFMVQNGGDGTARTEPTLGRVLVGFAAALAKRHDSANDAPVLAELSPRGDASRAPEPKQAPASIPALTRRISPRLDLDRGAVTFDFDDSRLDRLALSDAVLGFADRAFVLLERPAGGGVRVDFSLRRAASPDAVKALASDATRALNRVGRPAPPRPPVRIDALLADLDAADPETLGVGFVPGRGPEHDDLRVLNIRGTGACNSDCLFCVEKFDPSHRSMPSADATRQTILSAGGEFDMLFFASGEPTIHPKLFEYVEVAKTVGFTSFGMSSHFRTLADPRFSLRLLSAGFRYFDISLHAADTASQLEVNPIGDEGRSLAEALKGLAVLYRLSDALGIPISITQKIVVSRLNVLRLEEILRATFDRGVRHFIFQPVKTEGLTKERKEKLAISEDEAMPHLNDLIRKTEGLGAVIKPYGFSRQPLVQLRHVETERNRVKNVYGRALPGHARRIPVPLEEPRPDDGRHWVEIRLFRDTRAGPDAAIPKWGFASEGKAPILDEVLDRGGDASYGCRMGSCGMCCARLLQGEVDQAGQIFLSDAQVRDGYVLLCQARALSDVVLEVCTDAEIDAL